MNKGGGTYAAVVAVALVLPFCAPAAPTTESSMFVSLLLFAAYIAVAVSVAGSVVFCVVKEVQGNSHSALVVKS